MGLEAGYYGAVKYLTSGDQTLQSAFGLQQRKRYTWAKYLYADVGAQRDRFPSVAWLIERWHEWSDTRAVYFDRHMMVARMTNLHDHTHAHKPC